jgi:hypothetical protein
MVAKAFEITGKTPCKWQTEAAMAQLCGRDVVVIVPRVAAK